MCRRGAGGRRRSSPEEAEAGEQGSRSRASGVCSTRDCTACAGQGSCGAQGTYGLLMRTCGGWVGGRTSNAARTVNRPPPPPPSLSALGISRDPPTGARVAAAELCVRAAWRRRHAGGGANHFACPDLFVVLQGGGALRSSSVRPRCLGGLLSAMCVCGANEDSPPLFPPSPQRSLVPPLLAPAARRHRRSARRFAWNPWSRTRTTRQVYPTYTYKPPPAPRMRPGETTHTGIMCNGAYALEYVRPHLLEEYV